jgi:hypothetical protein
MSLFFSNRESDKSVKAKQGSITSGRDISLLFAIILIVVATSAANVRAQTYGQNCNALAPRTDGGDDAVYIIDCLTISNHATLTAGTFSIYQPIVFPQLSAVSLVGAGKNATDIVAQYNSNFIDSSANQYRNVIKVLRAPNATLSQFHLNLSNLRKSFGHFGNYALQVDKSSGTQVTSLKITGSQYGTVDYTGGWSHGGGILVVNSANSVINNVGIKDLGFTTEIGGSSAGFAGIQIASSGGSSVQNNNVARVSFNIQVINGNPAFGYTGDSSNTIVTGNTVTGPANIGCPDCIAGRGIKLEACSPAPPLQRLNISNNSVGGIGGPGNVSPSGIDLIAGVQYSDFTNNQVTTANGSSIYPLRIRSSFETCSQATHHNEFNYNTFSGGHNNGTVNVIFNGDGPDQGRALNGTPSIARGNHGTNTYRSSTPTSGSCSQYAHAWWEYPAGQTFLYSGQNLTFAAAGIKNNGSPVTFRFYDSTDTLRLTLNFTGGNGACVMNAVQTPVSLAPGFYKVRASYSDGNSTAFISNDWVGPQGQQVFLEIR